MKRKAKRKINQSINECFKVIGKTLELRKKMLENKNLELKNRILNPSQYGPTVNCNTGEVIIQRRKFAKLPNSLLSKSSEYYLKQIEKNTKKMKIELKIDGEKKKVEVMGREIYTRPNEYNIIRLKYKDKKRKLPKTFDEYCKIKNIKDFKQINATFTDEEHFISQMPSKFKAFFKLHELRDYYNYGWKPDYADDNRKYVIEKWGTVLRINDYYGTNKFLTFKTIKLRDKFFKNFKDLIKQAEDLI